MLEFLRKHTVVVMAAVALVFVGLVFLNDGKSGVMPWSSEPAVFTIDGTKYTNRDFQDKFTPYLQTLGRLRSLASGYQQMPVYGALEHEGSMMVNILLMRKEAERYGIYPGLAEIERQIMTLPEFCREDGTFDPELYERFLTRGNKSYRQMNETMLREVVGDFIRYRTVRMLVAGGIQAAQNFSSDFFESRMQNMEADTAFLKESNFRPEGEPGEEQIKQFWKRHEKNYLSDEMRDITVYLFKPVAEIKSEAGMKIAPQTNDVLDQVEPLWEKITEANAKGFEGMIDEMAKSQKDLLTMSSRTFTNVTKKQVPEELNAVLNAAAGATHSNLAEVAFSLAPHIPRANPSSDATGEVAVTKPSAEASTGITADHVSTALVLENGDIALIVVNKITPSGVLEYDLARPAARAGLLEEMTETALAKAAAELRTKLIAEAKTADEFKAIAEAAGAEVAHWDKVGLMTLPPGMLYARDVFHALRKVNEGGISEVVIGSAGDGAVIARLAKRTIADNPQMAMEAARLASEDSAFTQQLLLWDWVRESAKRHNLQISVKEKQSESF